jgi:hypothetical protein
MKQWLLGIILILLTTVADGGNEEITYPPRPKTTEIREIQENLDSLVWNVHDLGGAMVKDFKKNGLISSLYIHRKFYGAIFLYATLFFLWKRNRKR